MWFMALLVQTRIQPLIQASQCCSCWQLYQESHCWFQGHLPHSCLEMEQQDLKAGQGWVLELGNETELSGIGQRSCWCIQVYLVHLGKRQCSVLQGDKHCWDLCFARFTHITLVTNKCCTKGQGGIFSDWTPNHFYATTWASPNITKPVLTLASHPCGWRVEGCCWQSHCWALKTLSSPFPSPAAQTAGLVEPPDPCPHQLPWQCQAPPGCSTSSAQATCPQCTAPMQIAAYRNHLSSPLVSAFPCAESSQLGAVFWLFSRSVPRLCIKIFFSLFILHPRV